VLDLLVASDAPVVVTWAGFLGSAVWPPDLPGLAGADDADGARRPQRGRPTTPPCGQFWGHTGGILDYGTLVDASDDGARVAVIPERGSSRHP